MLADISIPVRSRIPDVAGTGLFNTLGVLQKPPFSLYEREGEHYFSTMIKSKVYGGSGALGWA
jgi:hypothetical protein